MWPNCETTNKPLPQTQGLHYSSLPNHSAKRAIGEMLLKGFEVPRCHQKGMSSSEGQLEHPSSVVFLYLSFLFSSVPHLPHQAKS